MAGAGFELAPTRLAGFVKNLIFIGGRRFAEHKIAPGFFQISAPIGVDDVADEERVGVKFIRGITGHLDDGRIDVFVPSVWNRDAIDDIPRVIRNPPDAFFALVQRLLSTLALTPIFDFLPRAIDGWHQAREFLLDHIVRRALAKTFDGGVLT